MDYITELFCVLDDFCKEFNQSLEKTLISDQKSKPQKSALSLSEAMTDSAVLRKRGIIEAPFHLMKSQFDLEHTRHRSKIGLLTTIFAALTLYALVLVNGYKSGIQQILKPIELKSA